MLPRQLPAEANPLARKRVMEASRFLGENDEVYGGIMAFDIRRVDLGKLNSMTKYPSILTYHALGDKGVLQETVQVPFSGRIICTEKVDGTNTRLIFCPDGSALVGSREDLLWERRDMTGNPAMGIVG